MRRGNIVQANETYPPSGAPAVTKGKQYVVNDVRGADPCYIKIVSEQDEGRFLLSTLFTKV